jgi:hypothetical protein
MHVKSRKDCQDDSHLAKTKAMIVVTVENCCVGLWFKIRYSFESFKMTSITVLLADSICMSILEISSSQRRMRIPSLQIWMLGSARSCVNPRKKRKVLISLWQSCGACCSCAL